jgi:hypothetical protein
MLSKRMLSIGRHFTAFFASLDNNGYQGMQSIKNPVGVRRDSVIGFVSLSDPRLLGLKGTSGDINVDSNKARGRCR